VGEVWRGGEEGEEKEIVFTRHSMEVGRTVNWRWQATEAHTLGTLGAGTHRVSHDCMGVRIGEAGSLCEIAFRCSYLQGVSWRAPTDAIIITCYAELKQWCRYRWPCSHSSH
jgi:hypothetical protein